MSAIADIPSFSLEQASVAARELFGINAVATALPSERDQNFALRVVGSGTRYVLKIANRREQRELLEAENAALTRLADSGLVPTVLPTNSGENIANLDGHCVRLISFLEGQPLGRCGYHSDALLTDIGRVVGQVNAALDGFDHPSLRRHLDWDLAQAEAVIERHLAAIGDAALAGQIGQILAQYRNHTLPQLDQLPRSVVHNDANDYNIIVADQRVLGLIDFGDMVYAQRVNDLAITMAYAALNKDDPVAVAQRVAAGYHAVNPLQSNEMAVAFNLMAMRLCVSACMAAKQQAERPDDPYLSISQAPIRAVLPKLAAIHPRLGGYLIRQACGLEPVPQSTVVANYLRGHAAQIAPLTGKALAECAVLPLDLGVGSPLVSSESAQNTPAAMATRIDQRMAEVGADLAVGGYGEARLLYTEPAYRDGRLTDPQRSIHLGVDLSLPVGTPLYAPLAGVVHGFTHAPGRLDYGPVIVLRHQTDDGTPFYTLYGHLSPESLHGLAVETPIAAGQHFASVGAPPDNGDWWPHVHLQLITDMLDLPVNFDGACLPNQRATWLSLCPDPDLLLRTGTVIQPAEPEQLRVRRQARIGGSVRTSYRQPLQIVRGSGAYLYDQDGRTYVDAYNNVPHVGHCHRRVVRAVSEQLATLNTNTRYLQNQLLDYAEALTARLPAELSTCYFVASGSEANELALRLARHATGAKDLLVMDAAYHGHSTTLIDISPYKHDGPGGKGAPDWVHTTPIPDTYRGQYRAEDPQAGARYAAEVASVIDGLGERGRGLCAYIAETCPSVGGQLLLPEGYLAEVYRLVRQAGGLCIADEVQTGFGRLGTHFWGFEQHQVVPDIVVLGKPIANGYPLGAVICRREIADAFDNGMEFFSTFGGSTPACVAGLATLNVVIDERLQAHALDVGNHLLAGLNGLEQRHELIGDVRGSGLFLGVELVTDRQTLEPAANQAGFIAQRMRERGVLIGTDGPHHNVLKIRGPMPLSRADADLLIEALDACLGEAPV